MVVYGTVKTISGKLYRVNVDGSLSAPIPRLSTAGRLHVNLPDTVELLPPAVNDSVLCWFPGDALCDGCIVGIVED